MQLRRGYTLKKGERVVIIEDVITTARTNAVKIQKNQSKISLTKDFSLAFFHLYSTTYSF